MGLGIFSWPSENGRQSGKGRQLRRSMAGRCCFYRLAVAEEFFDWGKSCSNFCTRVIGHIDDRTPPLIQPQRPSRRRPAYVRKQLCESVAFACRERACNQQ